MNQSFYRFGGSTAMADHYLKTIDKSEEPKLNSTFTSLLSDKLKQRLADYNEKKRSKPNLVEKDPIVRV